MSKSNGRYEVKIDREIHALIPPLTGEEREQLRENLQREGCRDPLVAWKGHGILLDGHNRLEDCTTIGIGYRVVEIDLPDRDAAKAWVIRNQFGRRNLTPFQRSELALQLKPLVSEQAKDHQRKAGGALRQNSAQAPIKTRDELARTAGVSHDTIAKSETIVDHGTPELADMARSGDVSVNAAAAVATLPKAQQKKIVARGPKAVKQAAKKAKEDKPAPVNDDDPFHEIKAGVGEVVSDLRSTGRKLGKVVNYHAETKQLRHPHAHFYSHSGTIGAVNAIVRYLEENLPAEKSDKPPGYIPVRVAEQRAAFAKGRK